MRLSVAAIFVQNLLHVLTLHGTGCKEPFVLLRTIFTLCAKRRKRYLSKLPSSTFLSRKRFRSTTMRSKWSPCLFGGLSVNHGGYFNKRWTNSLERNLCMSGTNQSNQLTSMCILLPSWQKRLLIAIGLVYFVNRTVNYGRKLRFDNREQAESRDGRNRLP